MTMDTVNATPDKKLTRLNAMLNDLGNAVVAFSDINLYTQ